MGTTQRKLTGEAVCTVCALPSYADLRAELDAGARVADVAENYGVSVAAVYRHRRAQHDAVRLIPMDDAEGLALADQLLLMFDRATAASAGLYAKGDLRGGSLVADHALRAASALAAQGLNNDAIKAEIQSALGIRRQAYALSRTVEEFVARDPQQAARLAVAAEIVGAVELAQEFRAEANTTEEKTP